MNTFYTILTDAGISTIISARANESEIKLSKMAVGDGEILPSSDMTSLLSEKYRFDIRSMTQDRVNPNHLIVEGVIPIDIGGFDISEIAIYTEDGTLFAIGNLPKTYKPQPEEGSAKELTIQVITEVANVDSVNISVVTSDLGVFKSEVETIKSEVDTITTTLDTKVDKVEGKGLSSNDFTDEYKNKLTNLSSNFKTINNESILGEGNIELIGSAHRSWYLEKTNSAFSLANTASTVINLSNIVSGDVELSQGGSFVIQEDGTYLVNFWTRVDNASSNLSLRAVIIINNIEKQFALAYHVAGGGDAGVDGSSVYEFKKGDIISFRLYQYGSTLNFPTGNVSAKITSINTQNALSLANYYSKEEVDTKINEIETGSTDLSDYYTKEQVDSKLETKQELLLSGENISTINGQSLLNGGDITIESTNIDDVNQIITTDNSYSILNNKLIVEGEPITKIFKDNVEFDSVRDNYIWKENDVVFLENVANSWFDIDYYIAPDGDDTNGDGSYDNPWKTFANVPLNCIAGLKAGQYKTSSYGYYATNGNFNSTHGLFKGLMKVEHAHAETRPANANPIMTDSNLKALLATKNSGYNNYTKATLIVSENKDALVEIIYDTNSSQRDKGIFTNMGLGNDLFVFKNLTFRRPINGGTNYSNSILRADSPITGLLIEECIFDFGGQPYSYNYIPGGAWVPIYNRCKFNGSLQDNYSGTQVIINDSTINCINYFDGSHPINCYKYINGEFVIYNNLNYTKIEIDEKLDTKQDTLASGTNIQSINGNTILTSGNIDLVTPTQLENALAGIETGGITESQVTDIVNGAIVNKLDKAINLTLTKRASNYVMDDSSGKGYSVTANQNIIVSGDETLSSGAGYTVPTSGKYTLDVSCSIYNPQLSGNYDRFSVYVYINGVNNSTIIDRMGVTNNNTPMTLTASVQLECKTGDNITLVTFADNAYSGVSGVYTLAVNNFTSTLYYNMNNQSAIETSLRGVEALFNIADDLEENKLDKADLASSLVTINNQHLTGSGNIQVARETALINMGIKYYNKVADIPNTDVGNQGIITGDFFFKEDSDTLSIDNFVTNNKSRLILTAGKTYNINIRINKTETSLQSKHLLCILEDIETATRKDIGNVYSVTTGNLRQILVDRQVTIEKDCYLYIVQNGGYITTPTTLNINIIEYSPSAEGYVDLNNLSTLSSPILSEEVLTEFRHPISKKPIYTKTIDFGALPNNDVKKVVHGVTNIENLFVDYTNSSVYNSDGTTYTLGYVASTSTSAWRTSVSSTDVAITTYQNRSDYTALVTINYTKTTDTPDSPVRLVGSAQNIYKLNEEIKTNDIWINGKPIYRKTIDFGNLTNTSEKRVSTGLTNVEDCWIDMNNSYFIGDNNRNYPLMLSSSNATGIIYSSVDHNGSAINITTAMNRTGWKAIVTINYTKTTDEVAN